MSFDVIPALDVSGGTLVRMMGSRPEPCDAFGGDPLAAAEAFVAWGAGRLHFVDVDLALSGRAGNLETLRRIAQLGVSVQASGGIHTQRAVREAVDAGAERVVVGSNALVDPILVEALIKEGSEELIFGLEIEGDRIHPRGSGKLDLAMDDAVSWLAGLGAARFLVTSVARVGSMGGPDMDIVAKVVASGVPVIAAGGIASVEHLRALAAVGAQGAVVGRAGLEGSIDIAAVLAGQV